jgi:hypothetical protein
MAQLLSSLLILASLLLLMFLLILKLDIVNYLYPTNNVFSAIGLLLIPDKGAANAKNKQTIGYRIKTPIYRTIYNSDSRTAIDC